MKHVATGWPEVHAMLMGEGERPMKKERTPEQIAKNPNPPKAPGKNSAARRKEARKGKPRK